MLLFVLFFSYFLELTFVIIFSWKPQSIMLYNTLLIILMILFTTFVQKYYFLLLQNMRIIHPLLGRIFGYIIRFWVIVHEMCHIFFVFLSGNKIKEIRLFGKNGGRVTVEYKNYIWDLPKHGLSLWFFSALILNQIGLFLIWFWPLFFWIVLNYIIFNYFWIASLNDFLDVPITFSLVAIVIGYSILIPSFALSIEDIEKFFISPQESRPATIVGSFINALIFLLFVSSFSYFFVANFIFFAVIFSMMFLLQLAIFLLFFWVKKFINRK